MYIIPFTAESIADAILVKDEAAVAEYFLTKDPSAPLSYRIGFAVASDFVLGLIFNLFGVSLREAFLMRTFRRLDEGMGSSFFWGGRNLVEEYFRPRPPACGD